MLPAIGDVAPNPSNPEPTVAIRDRMTPHADLPERPNQRNQWNSNQMTIRIGIGTPKSHNNA